MQPGSLTLSATSWDTSMVAMYSGAYLSPDREQVFLWKWGQPCTHHGCLTSEATVGQVVGNNSGIELLVMRRDGFVSIETAHYAFSSDRAELPSFTTMELHPPTCVAQANLTLVLNVQTSVIGVVLVELHHNGVVAKGYSLAEADGVVGNFLDKVVSWDHGRRVALPRADGALSGLSVKVAMADARVFSLSMVCAV